MPKQSSSTQSPPVCLITGASSGIGAALARYYAEKGFHLALCARRLDRLEKIAQQCQTLSPSTQIWLSNVDVTKRDQVQEFVQGVLLQFKRIDVVIANAGFAVSGPIEKLTPFDLHLQMEVNVMGVIHTLQATLPALKQSQGRLCLLGSAMSYLALPNHAAYSMSKFAIRALAYSLRGEFKPFHVSVTLINPGFIESEIRQVDNRGKYQATRKDFVPPSLVMRADLCAKKIYSAVKKRKREVAITFHAKLGIWMQRFFPRWVGFILETFPRASQKPSIRRSRRLRQTPKANS